MDPVQVHLSSPICFDAVIYNKGMINGTDNAAFLSNVVYLLHLYYISFPHYLYCYELSSAFVLC